HQPTERFHGRGAKGHLRLQVLAMPIAQSRYFAFIDRGHDIGVLSDIFQSDGIRLHQRMGGSQPQLPTRSDQHAALQAAEIAGVGYYRQTHVQLTRSDGGLDATPLHIDQINLDIRIITLEPRQQVRQEVTQHSVRGPYPHHPAGCMTEKERLAKGILQRIENMTYMLQELVALRREADAV